LFNFFGITHKLWAGFESSTIVVQRFAAPDDIANRSLELLGCATHSRRAKLSDVTVPAFNFIVALGIFPSPDQLVPHCEYQPTAITIFADILWLPTALVFVI